MPKSIYLSLILGLGICLIPSRQFTRPASAQPAWPAPAADDSALLQARLHATAEEWSIIYPMLQHIAALRDEVNANAPALPSMFGAMAGAMDTGTSLDAAKPIQMGMGPPPGSAIGPFDPKNAPGAPGTSIGRPPAFGGMPKGTDGNSVQLLLSDLQTLLANKDATPQQVRDKVDSVRAARQKARRDLDSAQKTLLPLLSDHQAAMLVADGWLD